MSTVEESPPEENLVPMKAMDSCINENSSKNLSDAETEPAMLEEEEMPSYMSITSLPIQDKLKTEQIPVQKTEPSEEDHERASSSNRSEHGADSVCVLSSSEESDKRPYEMMEDYNSDDMDMEEEEEDEEEDEEDDSYMNDEEDNSEGDIEPEQFERSSDDFVLRYDTGLEKHHKERSRSLQDLTSSRGNLSRFVGKRRSIDLVGTGAPEFFQRATQRSPEDPLFIPKKMSRSMKYDHVPSKVKLYIQEMKKQRMQAAERASHENSQQKNLNDHNSSVGNADIVSHTDPNPQCKLIKNYLQSTICDIEMNERPNVNDSHYGDPRLINDKVVSMSSSQTDETKEEICETDKNSKYDSKPENLSLTTENSAKKPNGLVDSVNINNDKINDSVNNRESNGQTKIPTILNLHSLIYEEYANGDETVSKTFAENLSCPKARENNEIVKYNEKNLATVPNAEMKKRTLAFEEANEKKLETFIDEVCQPRDNWNLRKLTLDEPPKRKMPHIDLDAYQKTFDENIALKRELEEMRKIVERCRTDDRLEESYRIALAENTSLKRELNETKKNFEKYRTESVPIVETKVATVQTEDASEQQKNKLSSDAATSTLASTEKLSDDNGAPTISVDPSSNKKLLNSDGGLVLNERAPPKTARSQSQSFITSSRILRTLANITRESTRNAELRLADIARSDSRHEQGQSMPQKLDPLLSVHKEINLPRAKKRKASDALDCSTSGESLKIPRMLDDARKKINPNFATDGTHKGTAGEYGNSQADDRIENKIDESMETTLNEFNLDNDDDTSNNVKYFVYHDEPGSTECSFLIQADNSATKIDETSDKDGRVRECGPFLLGNVEIRMSETNSTINIWGKEINRSGNPGIGDNMKDSMPRDTSSFVQKSPNYRQASPRPSGSSINPHICSSNKKARIYSSKINDATVGKCSHSENANLPRANYGYGCINHCEHFPTPSISNINKINICEHCESHHKREKLPRCEHVAYSQIQRHSSCLCNATIDDQRCGQMFNHDVFHYQTMYDNTPNASTDHRKCDRSINNATSKHPCVNHTREEIHKNQITSRNCSYESERGSNQIKQHCCNKHNIYVSNPCGMRLAAGVCASSCENLNRSRNHVSFEDEIHPQLSSEESYESPEIKRRRLSGQKVRGILTDMLQGCNDCRDPSNNSSSADSHLSSRVNLQNYIPKNHKASCSSSQAPCAKRTTSAYSSNNSSNVVDNEKCCAACDRCADMRAQIENQLENFRVGMEQLRARSHAILEMFNLLKADTD